jgi:hypothetical protein
MLRTSSASINVGFNGCVCDDIIAALLVVFCSCAFVLLIVAALLCLLLVGSIFVVQR